LFHTNREILTQRREDAKTRKENNTKYLIGQNSFRWSKIVP
jgi:hypothetical protein